MAGRGQAGSARAFTEVETFEYPEAPWAESLAELSTRLADVFPGPDGSNRGRDHDDDLWRGGPGEPARNGLTDRNDSHLRPHGASADSSTDSFIASKEEELAERVAVESQKAEERGRSTGIEMGLALGREEGGRNLEAERDRLHSQAVELIRSFAEEKENYYHLLEKEAVRLALAIAARILRREAQMDPLLLTGAVRVALGQLAESTTVRLRVPAQDQPIWEEALALIPGLVLRPKVIGEPRMGLGECRMETELGSADLGLWAQLKEIERGFFDRVGGDIGDRGAVKTSPLTNSSSSNATVSRSASTGEQTAIGEYADQISKRQPMYKPNFTREEPLSMNTIEGFE